VQARTRTLFPLGVALLSGGLWAGAPVPVTPPPGSESPFGFHDQMAVGTVLVPVVVRTPSGYASNLDRRDFTLLVDGKRVPIESFDRRTEAPTSLVFLQDLSGSMAEMIEPSRRAVRFFLDRSLPGDEFALASFANGRGQVEVPFTTDPAPLRDAIAQWSGYGTTALHDAVAWIPDISVEGHNSRRFAVLVTDGADNASTISPNESREIVRSAQVPVYVLGFGAGDPYALNSQGKKASRYADVLNLLALTTGGRYYPIDGVSDLDKALQAISDDLRHQYVLGFTTTEGAAAFRRLQVEVKGRQRFTVVFRSGYKGPPPAGLSRGG
jgi:Ca-activated chloride channel family protein